MNRLKKFILAALLIAVGVVLNRFISIKTPIVTISFTFVVYMLSGIVLGPWWSMMIAGLIDLIGALLFPFGAYFVGYTISAMLTGLIYGFFLYKNKPVSRKKFLVRIIVSVVLVAVICNLALNSLSVYIQTRKAVAAILPTRLIKQLILIPVEIVLIFFLDMGLEKMGIYKKYVYVESENIEEDFKEEKGEISAESEPKKED